MSKLTLQDYKDLNDAISRAASSVRFWYHLPNTFFVGDPDHISYSNPKHFHFVNLEKIAKETGATSDYDGFSDRIKEILKEDKYNKRKITISGRSKRGFKFRKLLGFKDVDIQVFNPTNPLPSISVGRRKAELIQIDGLSSGNTYDARVSFEEGYACFNEEDQDLAHRLGLIYFPTGIMEVDALTPSDFKLHKDKPKIDENGNTIVYCDNRACRRRVRNPILVVDRQTGGLYHSEICFWKDMGVKRYLAQERKDITIEPNPERVTLEETLDMYEKGRLQQASIPKTTEKFRGLEPWPEAAIILPH